jgi:hypothetical protein
MEFASGNSYGVSWGGGCDSQAENKGHRLSVCVLVAKRRKSDGNPPQQKEEAALRATAAQRKIYFQAGGSPTQSL